MNVWPHIARLIARDGAAALVSLTAVEGSTPREAGARMVVAPDGTLSGTVGGGELEHALYGTALRMLAPPVQPTGITVRHVLGPDLGQCCGGVAEARIEVFSREDAAWIAPLAQAEEQGAFATVAVSDNGGRLIRTVAAVGASAGSVEHFGILRTPLALFGAGHVGRALVLALAPLPFSISWIDTRRNAFPPIVPGETRLSVTDDPAALVTGLAAGTLVAVMTQSHALDLAIVDAALRRADLPYVGLIGSQTKRARFLSRLATSGVAPAERARLICPIGGRRLADKAPAVIAAAIAVELLAQREVMQAPGFVLSAAT